MARRYNAYLCALALLSLSLLICHVPRINAGNNNILQTKVLPEDGASHSDGRRSSRAGEAGLYLSLKHRDAPDSPFLQPRYKSRHELLQIVLERDEVRAKAFRDHIVHRRPRQATGMETENLGFTVDAAADSPPDPTGEGGAWLLPPAGAGEYYTELYVGTPRQLQVAMVDFASDVVWLGEPSRTIDAEEPVKKNSHFFYPSSSSSFTPIPSTSKSCVAVEGVHVHDGRSKEACRVMVATPYGQSLGYGGALEFAYEDIRLNRTAEHKSSVMREILFCMSQVQTPTGGVLGLGRGRTSFATQVTAKKQHHATFAYCLADTDEPSGSSLLFGEIADSKLAFTPLVSHPHVATFYMVNLVAMAVNGVRVPIPKLSSDEQQGGTIIDMSTRFTRLPKCTFHRVVDAVKARIRLPTIEVPGFHLCYSLANSAILRVPTVALLFENGARMALPMENLFVSASEQGDVMCLAMVPGRPGTATVIGSTQQQNFLMLVDRHRSRLGFAPRQCASFPKL